MSERQLRQRCRRLLRQLDLRPPLDVEDMCARLGRHRGKPIMLTPYPVPATGPFGIWLAAPRADYIVYQQHTTRSHQVHIILHEVGHLIAGHHSDEQDDPLRALYPHLSPELVRQALHRTSYGTAQEREAEMVATIILQWASVLDSVVPGLAASAGGQNMQDALSDRMGWL